MDAFGELAPNRRCSAKPVIEWNAIEAEKKTQADQDDEDYDAGGGLDYKHSVPAVDRAHLGRQSRRTQREHEGYRYWEDYASDSGSEREDGDRSD